MTAFALAAHGVNKSFIQGSTQVKVLEGLELQVKHGETVAVLGKSGSGKSTLLSLLSGIDHPTHGHISINGQVLGQLGEKELTRFRGKNLGIVFQQFHLLPHLSAVENVALPLEIAGVSSARAQAVEALEKVGLGHRQEHLPSQLSGGEKQRVAIARAFVVKPQVLLADEPSGSLDSATGDEVMRILFDQVSQRNMTLVLVTHNDELAKQCQRRLILEKGQLREAE